MLFFSSCVCFIFKIQGELFCCTRYYLFLYHPLYLVYALASFVSYLFSLYADPLYPLANEAQFFDFKWRMRLFKVITNRVLRKEKKGGAKKMLLKMLP